MSYKVALEKAWKNLEETDTGEKFRVKFLADEYEVDLNSRQILSSAGNVPPHEHIAILLLHYLIRKAEKLPRITGDWISFKQLPGGQGYYDAFKKRAIDPVIRKYGDNPKGLFSCLERMPGREFRYGDACVVLEAFENVPVLVTVWGRDEEFSADANVLFGQNIAEIFCTEDVAVLAGIIGREV